jgi:hypothetical protein
MSSPRVLREVAGDVATAANWYDEHGYFGLGDRFESVFHAAVARLSYSGGVHAKAYGEFRRIWLRPFPYAVFYLNPA